MTESRVPINPINKTWVPINPYQSILIHINLRPNLHRLINLLLIPLMLLILLICQALKVALIQDFEERVHLFAQRIS